MIFGRGAFFKSTWQDMADISECHGKEKMPKLRQYCIVLVGHMVNNHMTVIILLMECCLKNVYPGILHNILQLNRGVTVEFFGAGSEPVFFMQQEISQIFQEVL